MNCINCQGLISDIDDAYYGDQDIWREEPMCGQCAPSIWMSFEEIELFDNDFDINEGDEV